MVSAVMFYLYNIEINKPRLSKIKQHPRVEETTAIEADSQTKNHISIATAIIKNLLRSQEIF